MEAEVVVVEVEVAVAGAAVGEAGQARAPGERVTASGPNSFTLNEIVYTGRD